MRPSLAGVRERTHEPVAFGGPPLGGLAEGVLVKYPEVLARGTLDPHRLGWKLLIRAVVFSAHTDPGWHLFLQWS